MKVTFKRLYFISVVLFLLIIFFIFATNFWVRSEGRSYWTNYCTEESYPKQAALILGAGVSEDGEMSPIFKDRVITALNLYNENKVRKILISGDHGTEDYDEVTTAKDFLIENGVKGENIFLDHAGFDTYDSLYRAKNIFGAESLVVITQDFHIPRTVYIGKKLGLNFCAESADLHSYETDYYLEFREVFARTKAWLDILLNSKPKYLGEEISLDGDGRETWD